VRKAATGTVPDEILYDRMKTVWTGVNERGEIVRNAIFLDVARYWGFIFRKTSNTPFVRTKFFVRHRPS